MSQGNGHRSRIGLVPGLLLGSVAIAAVLSGCREEARNTKQPSLPTVQINPIVVLKPGEQIGGASNGGCRLTRAQMTDHLTTLNDFTKQHWNFQLAYPTQDGLVDPLVFEDEQLIVADLPTNPGARRFPIEVWLLASLPTANNLGLWDANKVNVFFTGNVQVDIDNPTDTRANTVDPSDAQGAVVRHIFINDFGFEFGAPQTNLSWNVLPHEFCHYLIRQKNARYNAQEHAPSSANQLMRPTTPHPATVVAADEKEASKRVNSGLVNAP